MRIKDTQITGIFKFDKGVRFTKNDFVIEEGILYYVNEDVSGEYPSSSNKFIEYSKLHSVNSISDWNDIYSQDKLITARFLKELIPTIINGIQVDGTIKTLNFINNNIKLHELTDTGAFRVIADGNSEGFPTLINDNNEFILNVYKFRDAEDSEENKTTVQELLDFNTPVIYLRSLKNGNVIDDWKVLMTCSNEDLKTFNESLSNYNNRVNSLIAEAKDLMSSFGKKFYLIDLSGYIQENKVSAIISDIDNYGSGIIKIFFKYTYQSVVYQESCEFDPNYQSIIDTEKVKISIQKVVDNLQINLTNKTTISELEIIKLLGTKQLM